MTTKNLATHWKHLLTFQVAVINPLTFGVGFGFLYGVLWSDVRAGITASLWAIAFLKIHWMYEVSAMRPGSSRIPVREVVRAFTSTADAASPTWESEQVMGLTPLPDRLFVPTGKNSKKVVHLPRELAVEHLMALEVVARYGVKPTESNLCGYRGPFTGKPDGTLAWFREYAFENGFGVQNKPGDWEKVYRSGWKLTREGRQWVLTVLYHNEVQALVPSPAPNWYKPLLRRGTGRKQ